MGIWNTTDLWFDILPSLKARDAYGGQPDLGWHASAGSCFTERTHCADSPQANKRCPHAKNLFTICETRVILR